MSETITVRDTAAALTVNADYLSNQFHKDMGITFIDFVNQERVLQAASLLLHTNLQIQQICRIVGFNNTSYFTRQFSKFLFETPSAYRRKRKEA